MVRLSPHESLSALMTDPHHQEAAEHLVRIQNRIDASGEFRADLRSALEARFGTDVLRRINPNVGVHDPGNHDVLEHISTAVEFACGVLGLDTQKGVVRGVLPVRGIGGRSSDFLGTGIAIVTIESSLAAFTDWLANLIVSTVEMGESPDGRWIEVDYEKCLERLRSNEELRFEWERFFLHFAGLSLKPKLDVSILTDAVLNEHQSAVKWQLTSAMEVFVVGHEYGHHIARHNAGESATSSPTPHESVRYESEADEIAWRVSRVLGAIGFAGNLTTTRNIWMESCAGVVLFLAAADLVRRTRQVLLTGAHSDEESPTHPSTRDRIQALRDWPGFADDPLLEELRHRRQFFDRLLTGVFNLLVRRFWAAHKAGIEPQSSGVFSAGRA
jgi:hypothetical protein